MKSALPGFLLATLLSSEAAACSCMPGTLEEFARGAHAIHFATLQQAKLIAGDDKRWPSIEGTFEIRKTLKGGARAGSITLSTPADGAACGVSMLVSATYLLFLQPGQITLHACGGDRIVERFQEAEVAAQVQAALKRSRPAKQAK